jgi:uncharacterized protein (DUF58 family)
LIPTLTGPAIFAAVAAAAAIALGLLVTSPMLLLAGHAALAALALAYLASLPKVLAVRKERLEFVWRLPPLAKGVVLPGVPFRVRCRLRNKTSLHVRRATLGVFASAGLEVLLPEKAAISAAPGQRVDFELEVKARAAGRHFLHGLTLLLNDRFGLIQLHLYFPTTLSLSAFPRPAAGRRLPGRPMTGSPLDRAGRHFLSLHGSGTELKEIRQHHSGDPFRSIDWKATARTGRLMVRQMESEIQATHTIILDASATMRSGPLGQRKLDYAVEAASAFARLAIERNDRVGLVAFDTRLVARIPPAEGRAQLLRISDALVGLFSVVDEDLTDLTDAELVEAVAAHLRQQEGFDLRRTPGAAWPYDVDAMVRKIRHLLGPPRKADRELATNEHMAELRRYCRARGLPIPYRGGASFGEKAQGLCAAFEQLGQGRQHIHSILLISDFEGFQSWERIERALKKLGAPRRPMLAIAPFAPSFARPVSEPLAEEVRALLELEETRRLQVTRRRLSRFGARLIVAAPEDMPALLYTRAAAIRH